MNIGSCTSTWVRYDIGLKVHVHMEHDTFFTHPLESTVLKSIVLKYVLSLMSVCVSVGKTEREREIDRQRDIIRGYVNQL